MADDIPKFSLVRDRYDQNTYIGRLYRCTDVVDPRNIFISNKILQESLDMLNSFRDGKVQSGVTDSQLWQARKIKEAVIHPDTEQNIFLPFRMSGYVPFGTISVVGMLLPTASLAQVVFWQWINQSHNACVNYANRNATKETPTIRFIQSYVGAVSAAVGIAVGLSIGVKRARFLTPKLKRDVRRFVAYPATSVANVCNVFMMRQNELREGIDVEDANGTVVGTSRIAAWKAVKDTALTRVVLPAPILVVPPIVMSLLERTKFIRSRPRLSMPINVAVCTLSFGVALPFAIAIFPQRSKISSDLVEEEIRVKRIHQTLYYNKGL